MQSLLICQLLKEWLVFYDISYVLKHRQDTCFFLARRTLLVIVKLFFSNFFQSSFSDGSFILFQLSLLITGLILIILTGCVPVSLWFSATVILFWKYLSSFLNTIKCEITIFHWNFQPNLIPWKKWFKKFFYNFICLIINHDFDVVIFWIITRSSSLSLKERKLIAIINWIFHASDFLRFFMISFNYGLILLRYLSTNNVLFLQPLLSYSI